MPIAFVGFIAGFAIELEVVCEVAASLCDGLDVLDELFKLDELFELFKLDELFELDELSESDEIRSNDEDVWGRVGNFIGL